MATYRVTDPDTGVTLELTGDSPPTEAELEEIFASQDQYASGSAPVITGNSPAPLNQGSNTPYQTPIPTSKLKSFATGAFLDYPVGMAQAATSPPRYADDSRGPDLGINPSQAITPVRDAATAANEGLTNVMRGVNEHIDELRLAEGRGDGTDWWRAGGNIAGALKAGKIKAPENLRELAKQGFVAGGTFGGITPTASDDGAAERAMNAGVSAVGGGLLAPVPSLAISASKGLAGAMGTAASKVRNLVDPFLPPGLTGEADKGGLVRARDRMVRELIGNENLPAAQRSLEGPLDPTLTGGQAGARSGITELAALDNVASRSRLASSTPYYAKLGTQRAQRITELDKVGGTADDLARAENVRGGNASVNYKKAYENVVKTNPELSEIFRSPFVKTSLNDAVRLAKDEGIEITNGVVQPKDLTRFIHFVKISLDKAARKTGEDALSTTERRAVERRTKQLVEWIKNKNPDYDAARTTFAADSIPVNQGQIGQALRESIEGPLGGKETPRRLAAAMANAPRTIKNATGSSRFSELGEVLSDSGEMSANRVLGRLENEAVAGEMAALGSPRVNQILGEFGNFAPPNLLHRAAMLFNNVMSKVGSSRQGVVTQQIADAVVAGPAALREIVPDMTHAEATQIIQHMRKLPSMQTLLRTAPGIIAQQGIQ